MSIAAALHLPEPKPVAEYIGSLDMPSRAFAYLGLDDSHCVWTSGGDLALFGLDMLKTTKPVTTQFNVLEGLLPSGKQPLIIRNTQFINEYFFDIHLFSKEGEQWIIFMDNTAQGRDLQANQQKRLERDIQTEEKNKLKHQRSIERLFTAFSDINQKPEEILSNVLAIGLDYFELDTALISMNTGDVCIITTIRSNVPTPFVEGGELNVEDTLFDKFTDDAASYSLNHVSSNARGGEHNFANSEIESYVGATLQTACGPYGGISFFSTRPREHDFTSEEEKFALLVAGSVGHLLGNAEQLDLVSIQNEHYKTLFESIPAMMLLCDADGLVISASNAFADEIGSASNEVPGKLCFDYFQSDNETDLRRALSLGQGSGIAANLLRRDLPALEVELGLAVKPLGAMKGIRMVMVTDVSLRNQASRESAERNTRLQDANEKLNQFAFIASHDLQEPLRKIQQFSSFLEEDLGEALDSDIQYYLRVIVDSSNRMGDLIHDLLSYSRTSKLEPEMENVQLAEVVKDVINDLDIPIKECDAKVEVADLPEVNGNSPLLRQLFTNLIGNGIKYRVADRTPLIKVFCSKTDGKDCIVVADNGIGLDMRYAKKIFEPFTRLHNSKEYKGNGIGLAICQTVCEKHGWSIAAEGTPDNGTRFIIILDTDTLL